MAISCQIEILETLAFLMLTSNVETILLLNALRHHQDHVTSARDIQNGQILSGQPLYRCVYLYILSFLQLCGTTTEHDARERESNSSRSSSKCEFDVKNFSDRQCHSHSCI
jgi:hypothetical protein